MFVYLWHATLWGILLQNQKRDFKKFPSRKCFQCRCIQLATNMPIMMPMLVWCFDCWSWRQGRRIQPVLPTVEYWDNTVTPFLFWISKGDLTRMTYAEFHGLLIARYILNEFKWIFSIFGRWWRWLYSPTLSLNQSTAVSYFCGNIL